MPGVLPVLGLYVAPHPLPAVPQESAPREAQAMTDAEYMRDYRKNNPDYVARLKKLAWARAEATKEVVRRHKGEYNKVLLEIKRKKGLL